jgi:HSP20 family molecular chaperone IbpA
VKIDIKDDVLTVSHAKEASTEKEGKYAYRGITQKSFKLAWRINEKFDLTKTKASLEKGLLKITIPIAPEKKPKEIEIQIQ